MTMLTENSGSIVVLTVYSNGSHFSTSHLSSATQNIMQDSLEDSVSFFGLPTQISDQLDHS